MNIDIGWSFTTAVRKISEVHLPWGLTGPIQRNRQIEAWGQLVGRKRALREFDQAVVKLGSLTALARDYNFSIKTLRRLREFYANLPIERNGGGLARGDLLGKWQLVEQIGSGGSAAVWRARSAKRDAALKVLKRARGIALARFRRPTQTACFQ
jgi:hypothetical protein